MALDRQYIEKRDFPIGRRGYEPTAVDAHLTTLAREIEEIKREAAASDGRRPAGESLASVASAQVQAIVEAAEASAAQIERDAREQAARASQEAAHDAQHKRDESIERSQEHVGTVHQATALMLQRVDAMEGELSALVESLRTGANRLGADLSLLSDKIPELYDAAGQAAPAPLAAPVPPEGASGQVSSAWPAAPAPQGGADETAAVAAAAAEAQPQAREDVADEGGDELATGAQEDVEGARLIALNMALNGQSRAETDRYLADNFDVRDRDALLDEVYATVEG